MNKKLTTFITMLSSCVALAFPVGLAAQDKDKQDHFDVHHHYQLIDLGTLGGRYSNAFAINDKGEIAGWSTLIGDTTVHAVLWRNGNVVDLGTFGGPNNITGIFSGSSVTEKGMIPGGAETLTPDPLGEDFCFFGTNLVCLPFVRRDGELTPLPTLGGDNGFANRINGLGEVAGLAENTTHDPGCSAPQVLQFKPVVWLNGEIRELPTVPGFPDGIATSTNDKGQVVGVSANCSLSVAQALLWDHGNVTNLGDLGGVSAVPGDINNRGQVVGSADLPDLTTFHAFLWQRGVMTDLGTLRGDTETSGNGINESGEIIGQSCNSVTENCQGFLWQNGVMADLNTLIPADSPLFLVEALGINDRGQIVGYAFNSSTGEVHGFLATPVSGSESATAAIQAQTSERPGVVLAENVRKLFRQRLRLGRFVASPKSAPLNGQAVASAPNAALSPTNIAFPAQAIGTTSTAKTVALKNTGTTSLAIAAIAIAGTNAGNFAQTHNCGSSLAIGASCSISVTFKPTASGARTATLSVTDNAAGSPQTVTLNGISTTAKLSPTSLSFGTIAILTTSAARTVTLTNVGTSTLTISGIAITGTNARDFAQTHNCGSSLAAQTSCSISLAFKPTASGARTAALRVTDNAAGSPQTVTLNGIGTTANLSPTSLSFGTIAILTTSAAKTVTLTNVGTTTLTISGIAITGTNAGDFAQTHNCGSSLTARTSCSISLTFKPTASGARTATLSVTDNAAGNSQAVSLGGIGSSGRCTGRGGQCASLFPPCCTGLVCTPATTRAFCEPTSRIGNALPDFLTGGPR